MKRNSLLSAACLLAGLFFGLTSAKIFAGSHPNLAVNGMATVTANWTAKSDQSNFMGHGYYADYYMVSSTSAVAQEFVFKGGSLGCGYVLYNKDKTIFDGPCYGPLFSGSTVAIQPEILTPNTVYFLEVFSLMPSDFSAYNFIAGFSVPPLLYGGISNFTLISNPFELGFAQNFSTTGMLYSTSNTSYERTGCFADYYSIDFFTSNSVIKVTGMNSYLYLYQVQPGGKLKVVKSNDDYPGLAGGSQISLKGVDMTKTYILEVTTWKPFSGSYTLSTNVGILNNISNPWETSATAGWLPSVTSVNLSNTDPPSHQRKGRFANYYKLTATQAGSTTIKVTGMNSYIYLYKQQPDFSLKKIASNDDSPGLGGGSMLVQKMALGDVYYLEVTTWGAGVTGAYTLSVNSTLNVLDPNASGGYVEGEDDPFIY